MKMKNKVIKLAAAVLAGLMLTAAGGCAKRDDGEVISAAAQLIERSYEVNRLYFGEGLPYDAEQQAVGLSEYALVTEDCGYTTVQELKDVAAGVFAESYCQHLWELAFEGIAADDDNVIYARYMEDLAGRLTVRIDTEREELNRTYDLESITVEKYIRDGAVIKVQSLVSGESDKEVTLTMKKENGQWRLASPTY